MTHKWQTKQKFVYLNDFVQFLLGRFTIRVIFIELYSGVRVAQSWNSRFWKTKILNSRFWQSKILVYWRFWNSKILNSAFWPSLPKSWIQDLGSPKSWIQVLAFQILNSGGFRPSKILNSGFWPSKIFAVQSLEFRILGVVNSNYKS